MNSIQQIGAQYVYPGRFLVIGNNEEYLFHVYGVTARSDSSRAKRYVYRPEIGKVIVIPTDAALMAQGDLALLDYTAAHISSSLIITGNGRQTDHIRGLKAKNALEALETDLAEDEYENDAYHTPRITGCALRLNNEWSQAVHIIRGDERGSSIRNCYEISTSTPSAFFISTYAGPNVRPTPSFEGNPHELILPSGTIEEITWEFYNAFAPQPSQEDLRVSVVLLKTSKLTGVTQVNIINSVDV